MKIRMFYSFRSFKFLIGWTFTGSMSANCERDVMEEKIFQITLLRVDNAFGGWTRTTHEKTKNAWNGTVLVVWTNFNAFHVLQIFQT